ncbi:uncharacterized protein PHALS_06146 [Plasmopara halstedii]|uniref:Uncharacterized protein n=1 Tax=Plasmopara halstedii TaxID=4781 RepID=A0A0P1B0X0_PLAHL|nr:uncharacterized protein PHALS_06146 [Plasmopara halstedii]CEG48319.1 hypothetical protein PHALS_06146 [Plasmopara halstedii]|eukprot:XP_024584688.1 hypothetical protein PHALS_06146 [Plasmopara halstedii]
MLLRLLSSQANELGSVLGMSIEAARGGDYFYRLTGSVPTWLNAEAAPFSVGDDESRY